MFHGYPYSDFHELNADWLLAEWKKFLTNYADLTGRVENVEKLIAEYKEYMDNYFDDLDITTEINNKIDQMIAGGQFAEILADFLPFVTPEMYGAVGDGVTDDTQAFINMAAANIPVYIPNKTYVIDRQVFINKLIGDFGEYINYEPLYKRNINVDLAGISKDDDILLPVITSYVEAITYFNNMYYVACFDYSVTPQATYIATYNNDFEYIDKYYTSSTYGVANSIFNDGEFIWVDYDTGYHVRYTPDILNATAFYNPTIRNYGYWNKTYYGIEFGVGEITVSELETDMITTRNSFTIQADYGTLQSSSVINGVVYIPTTQGNFYVIDIATHAFNKISYMDQLEIENFFLDKDGLLSGSGHYYGFDGVFNIYHFNGGVADIPFRYIAADGNYNISNLYTRPERTGVYHITNGTASGFPYNEGDLFITNDLKLYVCTAINAKYIYRNGLWRWGGAINRELIPIGGSGMRVLLGQGGEIVISFVNFHATNNTNTYTVDLSDMFSKLQLPDSFDMNCYVFGKSAGNIISANVYIGTAVIAKNSQAVYLRALTGSGIDCYINGEFFLIQAPN